MTPADKIAALEARRHFTLASMQPDAAIDLAHAALLVAAEDEPRFDVAKYRGLLYEMGLEARRRVERHADAPVLALNDYLLGELGFTGNQQDYYDPRNSLLNHVLDRRTGIPITLSVVYMDVGRRAGLLTEGVGLPGHFVVRVRRDADDERGIMVDPFQGHIIDEDDCQQRLDVVYGGQIQLSPEHLRPMTAREILVRLLRNLKGIYVQASLYRAAVAVVERILLLAPQAVEERRDRAVLLAQIQRLPEAIADMQSYLDSAPPATDEEAAREQLKRMRLRLAMHN
ncbi:MAG TPA: transglutaminase-like domain-containing protein [Pyrinomonadaceae bacterium]|jgi:regulator of sirC expression with transglutaminase-like and TPR domain